MVACTGFEPVNAALRGRCVEPLHQQAVRNQYSTLLSDVKEKSSNFFALQYCLSLLIVGEVIKSIKIQHTVLIADKSY